jgi:tripartite-type tricarboxylate transporter receptor subunit TctC
MIGQSPFVIAINPEVPAKSLKELIAHARANPGKISVATEGSKTFSGMMTEMFAKTAGLNLVTVPYSGVTPAQFGAFLNAEHTRWARLTRDVGVMPD